MSVSFACLAATSASPQDTASRTSVEVMAQVEQRRTGATADHQALFALAQTQIDRLVDLECLLNGQAVLSQGERNLLVLAPRMSPLEVWAMI